MNKIVNKFLLASNKFLPEMHLKQPGFTYSACEPFKKNKERIEKLKETEDTNYIWRKTDSDKFLRDKAFDVVKDLKYDGYQRSLASMIYKFFEKSPQAAVLICMQIMSVL